MENQIPMLLVFLFGEAAEAARQGASARLLAWAEAFDGWLAERESLGRATHKQALLAWKRLLGQQKNMPWEMQPAELAAHAAWMQAERYAPTTIANALGVVSNFYRWCAERNTDPACGADFNPATEVGRPKIQRYGGARLLNQEEAAALVEILRQDASPLGKRDCALFLARLQLGAPLKAIQQLRWEQIEREGAEAWVRWRPTAERIRLPEEVWEAIQASLAAGGDASREISVFSAGQPGEAEDGG